ncbi:MAG TPA: DUF2807 domain-containing protein [Salinimicrobium sp.]|nr:DUF2807 domain-containing protein [Salinimicrobium sp.]
MKRNMILLFFMVSMMGLSAQEKESIRGNKEVIVTQTLIEDFSTLEIGENFHVSIVKGNEAMVEIETDSNLHDVFQKEVFDGTFRLTTTQEIKRSKMMRIRITLTESLDKIILKDNAILETLTSLQIADLEIEMRNNSVLYATITAESLKLKNNDKSSVELNLTADEATFQLNHSSKIKALVNSNAFTVDLYESAEAKIEGDIIDFTLRADNSSKFHGQRLTSENAVVIVEGRSENIVNATKNIDISASGTTKTSIYGNPQFTITGFNDEAILLKKK